MTMRAGIGYDIHRKAKKRPLVLGGVKFESDWGLDGHSDADVLMHAIGDALLGTVGLGDLGQHFPPDDKKWKDAPGSDLLRLIRAMLDGRGARIVNVDATVVAEEPRLAEKRDEMRMNIAMALKLAIDQVSVKATTNEGLGAAGRGEGIAVWAIAMVETNVARPAPRSAL
jgi:2-C-methyl-D-erythritol 2,4-cyclodiphosphate synthase